jgi:hypothetical protein
MHRRYTILFSSRRAIAIFGDASSLMFAHFQLEQSW